MVAAALNTARHLPVQGLIPAAVLLDEDCKERAPLGSALRIVHEYRGEAPRQARAMLSSPKRPPGVHRHHFIGAVAKQKSSVKR